MAVTYIHAATFLPQGDVIWMFLLFSPILLLGSAVALYWRDRLGYVLAVLGVLPSMLWVHASESRSFSNSWIALNASWNDPHLVDYIRHSQIRILTAAISVVTFIWAVTRMLPARWRVRSRPVNQRTWPAVLIAILIVAYWFAVSVFPYRQPIIVDAVSPDLSILHVIKQGTSFHETRVTLYRNATYYLEKTDRKLFHYSFGATVYEGLLTEDLREKLKNLKSKPELKQVEKTPPRALHNWRAEGWYAENGNYMISAFTTENRATPPPEFVAFFRAVENIPLTDAESRYELKDVCLGFCYDPKAGLGYTAENQRCREMLDHKEHCY